MLVDVIRHQHERLGAAVRALMSLTLPPPTRVVHAMRELASTFGTERVPDWAGSHVAAIHAIVAGGKDVEVHTRALDAPSLDRLATAFFELYTVACREYWTA